MASGAKPVTEVRAARHGDMPAILSLISRYPQQLVQHDLPRAVSFVVAASEDKIVGCCALQIYSRRLAELRSLAIDPEFMGLGIAKMLVERCLQRARQRNVKQVLWRTRSSSDTRKPEAASASSRAFTEASCLGSTAISPPLRSA